MDLMYTGKRDEKCSSQHLLNLNQKQNFSLSWLKGYDILTLFLWLWSNGTGVDFGSVTSMMRLFIRPGKAKQRKSAGMMELVDMRDLGAVTSVKNYRSISGACDLRN